MDIDASIQRLLSSACPSIQYRMRKELCHQSPGTGEMRNLQGQITEDPLVRRIAASQSKDGWIGRTFHGSDGMEAGIRTLYEKGLEPDHPILKRAVASLEKYTDRLDSGFGTVGPVLDEGGFGGGRMVRAWLLAMNGQETRTDVKEQMELAVSVLADVPHFDSLADLYETRRGKLVFRPGIRWPGIYHLRLLAWAQSWRTPGNLKIVIEGVRHLVRLSPLPPIHVRKGSQLIAPASFCMEDFAPELHRLPQPQWMMWFHRTELLARMEVLDQVEELKAQMGGLSNLLEAGHGLFSLKLNHPYFRNWGAYTGLALETDWRTGDRRANDLTFRSLLILHYGSTGRFKQN